MSIGTTIKALRRARDITQEQLAEYLGITSRAVSQWECEKTSPDISQLPALASIFNVTADQLLGIDVGRKAEEIEEILKTAQMQTYDARWQEAVVTLREGLKKHPSSHALMLALSDAIVNDHLRRGIHDYSEPIALCEKILSESTDSDVRSDAVCALADAYAKAGDRERMLATVEKMPAFFRSKEGFMLWHNRGDEGVRAHQEYLSGMVSHTALTLTFLSTIQHDDGTDVYEYADKLRLLEQVVGLIELLHPEGDDQMQAQYAAVACSTAAMLCFDNGDVDGFFRWLNRHCDFVLVMDNYDFEAKHTSPAFREISDGGWIKEDGQTLAEYRYEEWMGEEKLPEVRKDPRFAAAMNRLCPEK